jgi:simple sugar transport system permease protein/ribose transport system permease protein
MAGLPLGRSAQLDRTAGHAAAPATFAERSRAAGARLSGIREIGILSALILIGVCLSFATPHFLTGTNLLNISRQMATIAIIAVGMTYLIISREFDLSVGSTYGLSGIVAGLLVLRTGVDVWLALPVVLVLGLLVGLVNGLMVTAVGIPSFIITLGTLSVLRGAALVLSNGWPVSDLPPSSFFDVFAGRAFGVVPTQTIWMVVVLLIGDFVLRRTKFGYHVYATGGNPRAARLTGINTARVKVINFMLSGFLAAFGGVITIAFLNTAPPTAGTGLELDIISAVVIGGTALAGGAGSILGTFLGAAIMATVRNGLVLLGVSAYWQQATIGMVIVIAVTVDVLSTRRPRND